MKKQQTATELINKIDEKVKHFEKLKDIRKNHNHNKNKNDKK